LFPILLLDCRQQLAARSVIAFGDVIETLSTEASPTLRNMGLLSFSKI
jgi:hypothetical protein